MTRQHRVLAFLAAVLLFAAAAWAQPVKRDFPGVINFVQVEPRVATGGRIALAAFPRLKEEGFTTIIALNQENEPGFDLAGERKTARALGLKYISTPLSATEPTSAAADAFLTAVAAARGGKLFIHCGSGGRVGALWLIKRVVQDRWPVEKAMVEAEAIGLAWPGLKQFALDYVKNHGT
jgi:uncharacterized protein (TIGR01244 family)